jgi:predicted O-methyltransferase YrrM
MQMNPGQYGDCSLDDPQVRAVLDRLHRRTHRNWQRFRGHRVVRLARAVVRRLLGRRLTAAVQVRGLGNMSPSVSREQGIFAYLVARSIGARRIVEFGTGFGASITYLAAAVKDNGGGRVIGSEIIEATGAKARANLKEAGLADYVDIRLGDAQETLADLEGVVDMAHMDGAKDLYLPVLKMLTPHLRPGAVVLADNIHSHGSMVDPYVAHVRDVQNGFQSVTLPFRGGYEYSLRLPAPLRPEDQA